MSFSKYLQTFLFIAIVVGIFSCGGDDGESVPPENPDQTINIRADYVGTLITSRETLTNQQIGLIRENDSTVKFFTYPGSVATDGFVAQVDDLPDFVSLIIPYQIIGGDTIEGVGFGTVPELGIQLHGSYNKETQELEYTLRRTYWNEEFEQTYVSDEIFQGVRVR